MSDPVSSMGRCRPDNHRVQEPTISTYAFDGRNSSSLDTRASIPVLIVLTYEDLKTVWLGKHNASLVHIVNVFL